MVLVQKLPFDVRQLVEQSPSVTGQGAPVLGSKHTSVHYLSRASGALHNTVRSDRSKAAGAMPLTAEEWEELSEIRAEDVLVVGQVQHEVQALDPLSGQTLWNVTHSAWRHMPIVGVEQATEPLFDVSEGAPGCCLSSSSSGSATSAPQHCCQSEHFNVPEPC